MIVDSSVLIAIILNEPDAGDLSERLFRSKVRHISAATLVETSIVLIGREELVALEALDGLIRGLPIAVVPVDQAQASIAREAFRRYGKGRHPAKLNMGDCFSYALAKQTGEPLLFKGNDFSQTDLLAA